MGSSIKGQSGRYKNKQGGYANPFWKDPCFSLPFLFPLPLAISPTYSERTVKWIEGQSEYLSYAGSSLWRVALGYETYLLLYSKTSFSFYSVSLGIRLIYIIINMYVFFQTLI